MAMDTAARRALEGVKAGDFIVVETEDRFGRDKPEIVKRLVRVIKVTDKTVWTGHSAAASRYYLDTGCFVSGSRGCARIATSRDLIEEEEKRAADKAQQAKRDARCSQEDWKLAHKIVSWFGPHGTEDVARLLPLDTLRQIAALLP